VPDIALFAGCHLLVVKGDRIVTLIGGWCAKKGKNGQQLFTRWMDTHPISGLETCNYCCYGLLLSVIIVSIVIVIIVIIISIISIIIVVIIIIIIIIIIVVITLLVIVAIIVIAYNNVVGRLLRRGALFVPTALHTLWQDQGAF
jgi:hypothetical protein